MLISSNRLDTLNSLLVKHRKNDISELLVLLEEMNLKLKRSFDFDSFIEKKIKNYPRLKINLFSPQKN